VPDAEETKSPRKKFGTLVWVLLSVSVVVFFLFAMAAPKFGRFAFNVKAREAKLNIASIRTAEQSYFNEFGVHVPAPAAPLETPGVLKMPWPKSSEGFEKIGWEPEGDVYCAYGVAVEGPAFTAEAICDLDGDGEFQAWGYVQPAPGSTVGIPGPFGHCQPEGVFDSSNPAPLLEAVGPCKEEHGLTIF
jgi:hypothetical protein